MRQGGKILADQLLAQKVHRVFSVPGESYLALLDGLHDGEIQNIVCRHEGGAAIMAEAHAKITGRTGIALVTRGPGATNAACGVHIAMHDSTPMILLVGQVKRGHCDRDAFQEIDIPRFFGPICKWAAEIRQTNRIPEYIGKAFQIALSGRPGPVVLVLPEDMLTARADVKDRSLVTSPRQPVSATDAKKIIKLVNSARRPLAIAGGSIWSEQASLDLAKVAKMLVMPVAASFRRHDYIDNRHSNYIGDLSAAMNPKLASKIRTADCLLLLGTRLGDISTSGYDLLDAPETGKSIIHIHPDPTEPGRAWSTEMAVCTTPTVILAELVRHLPARVCRKANWLRGCRADYKEWTNPVALPGQVQFAKAIAWLSEKLPEDAIVTNGAGNYAAFLHRHFLYKQYGTQVAPTSGSMGYGLPAAISAKLEHPDRLVVCVSGDGCLQMTLNEFSTAVQYKAPVIVVIANNGMYGTIRMHQEKEYPGRVSGTDLYNPDFASFALAYGGYGETVEADSDLSGAFKRAVDSRKPAILDLKLDPDAIAPGTTIDEIRRRHT